MVENGKEEPGAGAGLAVARAMQRRALREAAHKAARSVLLAQTSHRRRERGPEGSSGWGLCAVAGEGIAEAAIEGAV